MYRRQDFKKTRSWAISLMVLGLTPQCKWSGGILLAGVPLFCHALQQPGAREHWHSGALVFAILMVTGTLYAISQVLIIMGTQELVSRRTTPIREIRRLSRVLFYKAQQGLRNWFDGRRHS